MVRKKPESILRHTYVQSRRVQRFEIEKIMLIRNCLERSERAEIKLHHFDTSSLLQLSVAPSFEKKLSEKLWDTQRRAIIFRIVLFFIIYNTLYSRVFFMNTALRKTQVVVFKDICGKRSYLILLE